MGKPAEARWNQCQVVLDRLQKGEGMDRVTALQKYGIKSLPKIISMLRAEGFEFDMAYSRPSHRKVICTYTLRNIEHSRHAEKTLLEEA